MPESVIIALAAAASYFFGNINTALLISKIKKRDVRKMGSGNPGTMNMIRNFGVKMGALTLTLDVLKGIIPALLCWVFIGGIGFKDNKLGAYIGGLSVIVGHVFPVFLKFKGGKGIASTIGVCMVIQPVAAIIAFAVGVAFIFITKMGAITSFIIISVPIFIEAYFLQAASADALAGHILLFALFALTLFAHRKNVVKLFKGTESKTHIIKKKNKPILQETAV